VSTYRDPAVDEVFTLIRGARWAASSSDAEAIHELLSLLIGVTRNGQDERWLIAHLGWAYGTCRSPKVRYIILQSLGVLGVSMRDPKRMRVLLGDSWPVEKEEC
jgi:hypothetical protein